MVIRTRAGHGGDVWAVAFSADGKTLASGSQDKTVKVWHVQTGKCQRTLKGHSAGVYSVAIAPDGKMLASGSDDKAAKLWDVSEGR